MATRVTEEEVLSIMDTVLTEIQIEPHVLSANVFVTNNLSGKGLSDEILKEIERWLAAHMVSITKEKYSKEEGAGTAYIKYAGAWGEGLKSTPYGQTAISLDSSGTLAALSDGKKKAYTRAVQSFD